MKCFLLILSVTTSLFYSYMYEYEYMWCRAGVSVSGQLFDDPNQHFEKMTLDWTLRGSFNLSACVKEMMNCFELVRPDVICERDFIHDTVCAHIRSNCHDYYGNYDSYSHRFDVFEQYCRDDKSQWWT